MSSTHLCVRRVNNRPVLTRLSTPRRETYFLGCVRSPCFLGYSLRQALTQFFNTKGVGVLRLTSIDRLSHCILDQFACILIQFARGEVDHSYAFRQRWTNPVQYVYHQFALRLYAKNVRTDMGRPLD